MQGQKELFQATWIPILALRPNGYIYGQIPCGVLIPPFVRQWQQAGPCRVAIQLALTVCAGTQCLPSTD